MTEATPEPDPVPALLRAWFEQRDQRALDRLLSGHMDFLRRYAKQRLPVGLRTRSAGFAC